MADLTAYVPRLLLQWEERYGDAKHYAIEGTLVFADVSGFTKLSEALARKSGKAGAEEMADVINYLFGELLMLAAVRGGEMLKYGGDAMLLFFSGADHALRGAAACADMQRRLHQIGRIDTGGAGVVRLRMSVGAHSGNFDFFVAGRCHRELIVAGPDTTVTVEMEAAANATEVLMSPAMAAMLPARHAGASKDGGVLLRGNPRAPLIDTVPLVTHADPRRFLAAPLVRHLGSDGAEPEHRLVTVAFLQFLELDRLLYAGRAEDAAEKVDDVLSLIEQVFLEFDVTFLATDLAADGGKVMAAAGAPTTRGDDEERMLRACRKILDSSPALPVRIGVNHGHVFAGDVGPSFRRTYTTLGDVTNTAARVMGKGLPGQCLVLEPVLRSTVNVWSAHPLPPFMAKGKSEPLVPWLLGEPGPRRQQAATTLLVGREAELRDLERELAASEAEFRVVDVVGEPGLGKSRLVSEVAARATQQGRQVIEVTAAAIASSIAFRVVADLATAVLGPLDADVLAASVTPGSQVATELPLVGLALGVDLPDNEWTATLDPAVVPDRISAATAAFLRAVLPPLAFVVVDDAHNADPSSSAVLARLRGAPGDAALVCVTRRDTGSGWVPAADRTIELGPLGAADALRLVEASSGVPLLPQDLERIAARAGGNPLFALQLAATGAGDDLPDSLEEVIAARIDELPSAARDLLRQLSVLGTAFDLDVAGDLVGESVLAPHVLAGFVSIEAGRVRFEHELLQQTAYAGLPFRRRRELHGRTAAALMRRADESSAPVEELSYHSEAAAMWQEAWGYATAAAREAERRYAFSVAAIHWRRAAKAAKVAGTVAPLEIADAWNACGEACRRAGQLADAQAAYRLGRKSAPRQSPQSATLAASVGRALLMQGRVKSAATWAKRANAELEALQQRPFPVLASVTELQAEIARELGRHERVVQLGRDLVSLAASEGSVVVQARVQNLVHDAARALNLPEVDVEGARALQFAEQAGDGRLLVGVLSNLALTAEGQGDWRTAASLYERASEEAGRAGFVLGRAVIDNNVAEIRIQQGRLDDARVLLDRAYGVARAAGHWHASYLRANIGWVTALAGDLAGARETIDTAAEELSAVGLDAVLPEIDRRLVVVALLAGDFEQAFALLDGRLATHAHGDAQLAAARSHAYRQSGDRDGALACARVALDIAESAGNPVAYLVAHEAATRAGVGPASGYELAAAAGELGLVSRPAFP